MVHYFNRARIAEDHWFGMIAADVQRSAAVDDGEGFSLAPSAKYYDAFPVDGVGDLKPITISTALVLTPDQVGDDIGSSATISVGRAASSRPSTPSATRIFSQVQLVAGHTYDIGQYLRTGGPSGVPLADAYLELYDAAGNLVTTADGGGPTRRAASTHCSPSSLTERHVLHQCARLRSGRRRTAPPAMRSATMNFRQRRHRHADLRALLRCRQPASFDRLGQPGRPHLTQSRRRRRAARHRQRLYRGGRQPLRDRGQERHQLLFRQGRRHLRQ